MVVGRRSLIAIAQPLQPVLEQLQVDYGSDCSEAGLASLRQAVIAHQVDLIIGVGRPKHSMLLKLLATSTAATSCHRFLLQLLPVPLGLARIYSGQRGISLQPCSLSRFTNTGL